MRARRAFGTFAPASDPTSVTANNFAAAVATYEESIAVVSSSRMYDLYAAFLLDQVLLVNSYNSPERLVRQGNNHNSTEAFV